MNYPQKKFSLYLSHCSVVIFLLTGLVWGSSSETTQRDIKKTIASEIDKTIQSRAIRSVECQTYTKAIIENNKVPKEERVQVTQYVTDGTKFNLIQYFTPIKVPSQDDLDLYNNNRFIFDGKITYQMSRSGGQKKLPVLVLNENPSESGKTLVSHTFDSNCEYLFRGDSLPFSEILRRSKSLKVSDDVVGAEHCIKIECTGSSGIYLVWISKDKDYQVIKAHIEKQNNDELFGTTVRAVLEEIDKNAKNNTAICHFIFDLSDVSFITVDGKPVISEFKSIEQYKVGDGSWYGMSGRHIRTKVSFPKPEDLKQSFIPEIENGTTVMVVGQNPIIPMMWQDGKVVKGVGTTDIQRLDRNLERKDRK